MNTLIVVTRHAPLDSEPRAIGVQLTDLSTKQSTGFSMSELEAGALRDALGAVLDGSSQIEWHNR